MKKMKWYENLNWNLGKIKNNKARNTIGKEIEKIYKSESVIKKTLYDLRLKK